MKIEKKFFSLNNICVGLLIIFTAVVFFIRSHEHVPTGDEVMHQFVYEDGDDTPLGVQEHSYERRVETLSQAFSSQLNHYKLVNGRFLVHFIEQCFTGHETLYFVLNTILFFVFVFLLIRYSVKPQDRGRYSVWVFTLAVLLLLFPSPSSLWTSII